LLHPFNRLEDTMKAKNDFSACFRNDEQAPQGLPL